MPNWRLGAWLLLAAAYAMGSHWLMLHAADKPWAIAALLGPLLLMLGLAALRQRHLPGIAGVLVAAALIGLVVQRGGVGDVHRLYVLQHALVHLALCVSFAATLRPGRLPLITRAAQRVHGPLQPAMAVYTRQVTLVWAIYFLAMAMLSVLVYLLAPWSAWSLLANVLTPLAIAALFGGEYLLRYRLHPEFDRATMADAFRAYRDDGRPPSAGETLRP
jgi:uncharacterized membrane protein